MKKIRQDHRINEDKSYTPDSTLVNFVQNWLHLHKKKASLMVDGKDLSEEEKDAIRESDRMKVYVLDKIVFPSFANLIYFFEALGASRRLSEAFEDEVTELLDPRKAKEAARFSGGGMRMSSIQFRQNNLARLIMAMLSVDLKKYPDRKPIDDFRIGLMYQILNIVGDQMDSLLMHEFSFNQIWKSFWDDYMRMEGWLALLSRSEEKEPAEYERKMGFWPIWISNKAAIHEMEF